MRRHVIVNIAFALMCMTDAQAQNYPFKTIRLVVPFAATAPGDVLSRLVARKLTEMWGQPVFVDNRPGAGTVIGTELVAKAPPDGYTLMLQANPLAANQTLYQKLSYDALKDFVPVIFAASTPNVLVVHPSVPAKTVTELITLAKKRPDDITYASGGAGSASYLAAEFCKLLTGIKIVHVPFKGTPQALVAVMAGEVQMMIPSLPSSASFIKQGRLRALGLASSKRALTFPELPTLVETGIKGFTFDTWYGYFAPAGVGPNVVAMLNGAINKILSMPEIKDELARLGLDTVGGTPEAFAAYFRVEVETLGKVIRASGAKPD